MQYYPAPFALPAGKPSHTGRVLLIIGLIVVLILAALGGGAFVANASLSSTYSPERAVTDYLAAQKKGAIDAFRASLATYRQAVLLSFGQVADTLRALGHDADLVDTERRSLDASDAALGLQRVSYAAGKVDVLRLLDSERSYQQARLGYTRAKAQRYLDSALLLVAMGGGWWENLA